MRPPVCLTGLVLISAASSGVGAPTAREPADTPENRTKATERYLRLVPMKALLEDTAEQLAQKAEGAEKARIVKALTEGVDIPALEKAAAEAMVKHFTVREINALADFYASPEGRSVMKKFGAYMAEVMPVIQREVERALKGKEP
jgi:hypothetical protein